MLAGLGLGFGLGIGITLLTELLDKTFKRGRDVEAKLGIPHIVDVPLLPARQLSAGGPTRTPGQNAFHFATQHIGSPFADAMLGLLSSLQSTSREAPIKTVMFTSATPGEGKSVVAANFAQTAARSGFKVLLICTDLRTPTVNWFGPTNAPKADLVDYLNGKAEIEATIARSEQALIDLIPAARSAANAASLLASPRMDKLLEWAKANYDLVVIDTVAVVTCLDGRMLARPHRCHGGRHRVAEDQGRHDQGSRRPAPQERCPHRRRGLEQGRLHQGPPLRPECLRVRTGPGSGTAAHRPGLPAGDGAKAVAVLRRLPAIRTSARERRSCRRGALDSRPART